MKKGNGALLIFGLPAAERRWASGSTRGEAVPKSSVFRESGGVVEVATLYINCGVYEGSCNSCKYDKTDAVQEESAPRTQPASQPQWDSVSLLDPAAAAQRYSPADQGHGRPPRAATPLLHDRTQ